MSFETVEEKVEFLNGLTKETLDITFYTNWDLSSYGKNTLFAGNGGVFGPVCASTFKECVNKAFQLVVGGVANG